MKLRWGRATLLWLYAIGALLLGGCGGPRRASPQVPPTFVPPTAAPVPTAAQANPQPTILVTTPTAPACTPDLRFVADETIPDGTEVPPQATLLKVWRVRNAGTCPWGPGYTLRFVAGDPLDAEPEQPLFPAPPGGETRIQVRFRAPAEPGVYQSVWQAADPQGVVFGDPIFIVIEVVAPTPTPGQTPTLEGTPTAEGG